MRIVTDLSGEGVTSVSVAGREFKASADGVFTVSPRHVAALEEMGLKVVAQRHTEEPDDEPEETTKADSMIPVGILDKARIADLEELARNVPDLEGIISVKLLLGLLQEIADLRGALAAAEHAATAETESAAAAEQPVETETKAENEKAE